MTTTHPWIVRKTLLGMTPGEYCKALITPVNVLAALIVAVGLTLIGIRFFQGLASVTHASDVQPWGLLLGVGLFCAVPLSASGFVLGSVVYLFRLEKYYPVVKNAILIGLLGYLFAVVFLMIDLGRPWRIYFPMFVSFGPASVMFLVAWHVTLYLTCQALEFAPEVFSWLGAGKLRKWAVRMTIGLTIFGVILSTLHQSALGALFLIAPEKLHPLWYTPYLPWLFFVSAIVGGLCMVIVVGAITKRFLRKRTDAQYRDSLDRITLGLGMGACFTLFTYFGLKVVALAHGHHWDLLNTPFGQWYMVEMGAFVLLPCILFVVGIRARNVRLVRLTAFLAILGIIVNRLNVSLIAFNWKLPGRELFHWGEFLIVLAVITIQILLYRWIVNRMPVLREHSADEIGDPRPSAPGA